MSILRQFCLYLSHFDPRTCIVHRSFLPHRTRPAPHIFTGNEVRRIMAASSRIGSTKSLRPLVFSTLVGLLYSTGLRIGEALKLTIGDVDLKRRLIHVREAKFKKSRYVPISQSAADHLAGYLHRRRKAGFPSGFTAFLSTMHRLTAKPLSDYSAANIVLTQTIGANPSTKLYSQAPSGMITIPG